MSKKSLILHEQISLAGFNDKDYALSSMLYNRITSPKIINDEYLMTQVATCNSDYFNSLSRIDLETSHLSHLKKSLIYVAIYNGCVDFIRLSKYWQWEINDIASDSLIFNAKTQQSNEVKKAISSLLLDKSPWSYERPMQSGNGGGQETNGGNGVIAEYLNIFQGIVQDMPREIKLDENIVLKRNQFERPAQHEVLTHSEWSLKTSEEKKSIVINDQLTRIGLKSDYLKTILLRLEGSQKINFEEMTYNVNACQTSYLAQFNRKDMMNNFSFYKIEMLLPMAIKSQCLDFIKFWSEWNFSFNYCPQPLNTAILTGNSAIVDLLLDGGADPQFYCRGEIRTCDLIKENGDNLNKYRCQQ